MYDKFKYIFNKLIDFIKIVFCVTITGLISVLFGRFIVWLLSFFDELLMLQ